jgi:hypothetical protein
LKEAEIVARADQRRISRAVAMSTSVSAARNVTDAILNLALQHPL